MKKNTLLIVVSLLVMICLLIYSQVNAAEWNTEEGFTYLMDEEYQVKIAIIRCVDRYSNKELAKQCSINQANAYVDVVSSMAFLFKGGQDGFDVEKPLSCLAGAMDKYWDPEYDSANWVAVQNYTSQCMDQ
jgi:hypothetical protein